MGTVSKEIADRVVFGEFAEDNITRIVEYDNAFGGVGYGIVSADEDQNKYMIPTPFIQNPRIYWEKPHE